MMSKTIHVDDLPESDPAQYLDNEESIAVYLTGILEANNAALLASALGDIARGQVAHSSASKYHPDKLCPVHRGLIAMSGRVALDSQSTVLFSRC